MFVLNNIRNSIVILVFEIFGIGLYITFGLHVHQDIGPRGNIRFAMENAEVIIVTLGLTSNLSKIK